MARVSREEAAGAIHHVIPAGNNGGRIVEDDRDRASYLARFARIRRELGWLCHASCLMDTHHHAVVETPMPNLGLGMRRLLGGHSHWFNLRHGRTGSVFTPHFWSRRVTSEAWFFRACLYTVLNPVAAGLCAHPREWRWCSYRSTAEGDPTAFAPGEERLLRMFGQTPADARATYATVIDDAVARIRANRVEQQALWAALQEFERRGQLKVSD